MKFFLAALALIAIVRPEHFIPVALTGAIAIGALLALARILHGEPLFADGGQTAAKVLLVVMTAIAVVRPEHLLPVVVVAAVVMALYFVGRAAMRAFRSGHNADLATDGHPRQD
jgi:hypothetical protein